MFRGCGIERLVLSRRQRLHSTAVRSRHTTARVHRMAVLITATDFTAAPTRHRLMEEVVTEEAEMADDMRTQRPNHAPANPTIALRLQSTRPAGRVAELESFGIAYGLGHSVYRQVEKGRDRAISPARKLHERQDRVRAAMHRCACES